MSQGKAKCMGFADSMRAMELGHMWVRTPRIEECEVDALGNVRTPRGTIVFAKGLKECDQAREVCSQ